MLITPENEAPRAANSGSITNANSWDLKLLTIEVNSQAVCVDSGLRSKAEPIIQCFGQENILSVFVEYSINFGLLAAIYVEFIS